MSREKAFTTIESLLKEEGKENRKMKKHSETIQVEIDQIILDSLNDEEQIENVQNNYKNNKEEKNEKKFFEESFVNEEEENIDHSNPIEDSIIFSSHHSQEEEEEEEGEEVDPEKELINGFFLDSSMTELSLGNNVSGNKNSNSTSSSVNQTDGGSSKLGSKIQQKIKSLQDSSEFRSSTSPQDLSPSNIRAKINNYEEIESKKHEKK